MNLVLSEVEETVSIVDVSEDGVAQGVRVSIFPPHLLTYLRERAIRTNVVRGHKGLLSMRRADQLLLNPIDGQA
jgi:hypothetical protein